MKTTEHVCPVCGKKFIGRSNAIYCCDDCQRIKKLERLRERYKQNIEREQKIQRDYYKNHKEAVLAINKKSHEKNKDKHKAYLARYYQENNEKWKNRTKRVKVRQPRFCTTCGKELTGKQLKYCNEECRKKYYEKRRKNQ